MGGILFASQSAALTGRRVDALSLANQQIELARNLPFDDVATVVSQNGLPSGKITSPQTIGAYTVTTNVAYGTYDAQSGARYKTIAVTVSWTNPIPGSVSVSTNVAGFSATADYNFGTVGLQVQDESGANLAGVTVNMTDLNGRAYSKDTTASGTVTFDYVPSGSISFSSTKPGYFVDSPSSPSCTANTVTAPYLVTAHPVYTGTVRCLSASGTAEPGIAVTLATAPILPTTRSTDASGNAIFASQLIKNTYAITTAANAYFAASSGNNLTITTADASKDVALTTLPSTVVASGAGKNGSVWVWSANHDIYKIVAASTTSPYNTTITINNGDDTPRIYYFTKTNTWKSTASQLSVTAGVTTYTVVAN
jgi:hypothetical protein